MKQADKLILAARIFDAVYQTTLMQEKDNNPEHWKTINGAHVHVDENGNYDGGAGGLFNGKHHYGQGYKEKAEKDRQKAKENVAKEIESWKRKNEERPMYKAGESFEDWRRRDNQWLEKADKEEFRAGLEYDLGEEAYNKLTPEEIVKRVNARYEGTEQCEQNEGGYLVNPLQREAEQKAEYERRKNWYEFNKEAAESNRKWEEHWNSEEGKAEPKEARKTSLRKQIKRRYKDKGLKMPTEKELENLVNEEYARRGFEE